MTEAITKETFSAQDILKALQEALTKPPNLKMDVSQDTQEENPLTWEEIVAGLLSDNPFQSLSEIIGNSSTKQSVMPPNDLSPQIDENFPKIVIRQLLLLLALEKMQKKSDVQSDILLKELKSHSIDTGMAFHTNMMALLIKRWEELSNENNTWAKKIEELEEFSDEILKTLMDFQNKIADILVEPEDTIIFPYLQKQVNGVRNNLKTILATLKKIKEILYKTPYAHGIYTSPEIQKNGIHFFVYLIDLDKKKEGLKLSIYTKRQDNQCWPSHIPEKILDKLKQLTLEREGGQNKDTPFVLWKVVITDNLQNAIITNPRRSSSHRTD